MTKYDTLWRDLLQEKEKIEYGEKILFKRKKEVMAMIEEIRHLKREMRPKITASAVRVS